MSPSACGRWAGSGPSGPSASSKGWAEQKVIREIMLFLHGHGVGTSRAVRIFKTYGADAVQVITENPYRLARDIRGIGFKSADQIAARLGIEKTAMIRARAGISYALAEAMDEGHCGLPTDELRALAAELLEIPPEVVDDRPRAGARRRARWWPTRSRAAPACSWPGCTGQSAASPSGCCGWPGAARPGPRSTPTRRSPGSSARTGIALAASQREAVRLALRSKLLVITGGPGVGKTTLVNSILKILPPRLRHCPGGTDRPGRKADERGRRGR